MTTKTKRPARARGVQRNLLNVLVSDDLLHKIDAVCAALHDTMPAVPSYDGQTLVKRSAVVRHLIALGAEAFHEKHRRRDSKKP